MVGQARELGSLDRRQRDGQRACVCGRFQRGERVRRAAARAHTHDSVGGGDRELLDREASGGRVVLGRLALGRRKAGTRDERHDLPGGGRERPLAFLGVELRDASGRACAHVDEPPAGGEPGDDRVDRRCELVRHRGHSGRDRGVRLVHQLHQIEGRARGVIRIR